MRGKQLENGVLGSTVKEVHWEPTAFMQGGWGVLSRDSGSRFQGVVSRKHG